MPRLSESQRESFEALRRAYLEQVPVRVAAIRRAAGRAALPGAPRAAREQLRHLVHQLVGSSAIFGLPRLCASARALEDLAIRLLEGGSGGETLDALLAALDGEAGGESDAEVPARGGAASDPSC